MATRFCDEFADFRLEHAGRREVDAGALAHRVLKHALEIGGEKADVDDIDSIVLRKDLARRNIGRMRACGAGRPRLTPTQNSTKAMSLLQYPVIFGVSFGFGWRATCQRRASRTRPGPPRVAAGEAER